MAGQQFPCIGSQDLSWHCKKLTQVLVEVSFLLQQTPRAGGYLTAEIDISNIFQSSAAYTT